MKPNRPATVNNAVIIFYAALAIGVIRSILEYKRVMNEAFSQEVGSLFIYTVSILTFGFTFLIIYLIGRRKNWARWLMTILFVIGAPLSIGPLVLSLQNELFSGVLGLIQILAQVLAIVFLFQGPSREWFKKPSQELNTGNET